MKERTYMVFKLQKSEKCTAYRAGHSHDTGHINVLTKPKVNI